MAEPSEWAKRVADDVACACPDCRGSSRRRVKMRNLRLALDAARAQAIEECAKVAQDFEREDLKQWKARNVHTGHNHTNFVTAIAAKIRALASEGGGTDDDA